ncbi:hypothetical protein B0H13DRAFT_2041574, partial [Mycena leptocephala]
MLLFLHILVSHLLRGAPPECAASAAGVPIPHDVFVASPRAAPSLRRAERVTPPLLSGTSTHSRASYTFMQCRAFGIVCLLRSRMSELASL